MKAIYWLAVIFSLLLTLAPEVEARYVTRASRNLVRHIKRRLERTYGLGLTNLIHPVTKEFNHAAVIENRGGRHEREIISDTKSIGLHHAIDYANHLIVGQSEKPEYLAEIEGKQFDRYDIWSFFYGWVVALHADPDSMTSSNCFLAAFEAIQQVDYLVQDFDNIFETSNYFNLIVFTPTHLQGNMAAAYEYCNGYIYVVQISMIAQLDFGYLSEMITRYSMILSTELTPFLAEMTGLLAKENVDFYLVGFRWGMLWKIMFDVKLDS